MSNIDSSVDDEILFNEVKERRQELIEEQGEDEYDIININEILRDEFGDSKYEDTLIELDINKSDEDLGLKDAKGDDDSIVSKNDDDKKENIVKSMLKNNEHLQALYLTLMGYEEFGGTSRYTGRSLIPRKDIYSMIKVLYTLYQPQSLSAKLQAGIKNFDDHYNNIIHNLRRRLTAYTDDICTAKDMRIAVDLYLNEVQVVRNAVIAGRLGDLTRDIAINTYNEKVDINEARDGKLDGLKKDLGIKRVP